MVCARGCIDADNAKFRIIEHLHAWHQTMVYSQTSQSEATGLLTSLRDTGLGNFLALEISLEAYKDSAETNRWESNPFGIRVWNYFSGYGAYPAPNIANSPSQLDNRCFFGGFKERSCLAYAFLIDDNDVNLMSSAYNAVGHRKSTCKSSDCRYCFMNGKCMFSMNGANEDLFLDYVTFSETQIDGLEYDPAVQDLQYQHVKFTNKKGKEYFVRCPFECKSLN